MKVIDGSINLKFSLDISKCRANWQVIEDVDCDDNDCIFSFLFDDGYRKLNSYRVFKFLTKVRSWKIVEKYTKLMKEIT